MKTIAITVTHGMNVRNMLRTDIFKILKSEKDVKIILVILRPFHRDEKSFAAQFGGENVKIINWPFRLNPVEWMLKKMSEKVFFNINHVETIRIKEMELKKNYLKYLLDKLMKKVLGSNRNFIEASERLDTLLFRHKCKRYWGALGDNKPSLIFSTDFLCLSEWGLIKAARHYGAPVISFVPSWDHLIKGRLSKSDKVIVWNDIQKRQLTEFYGYTQNDILVAGIPQFDYYEKVKQRPCPREEFLKSIGMSPDKKLITYTTSPSTKSPLERDTLKILCEAIRSGKIEYPSQLYVRVHPADDINRYEGLQELVEDITFNAPGQNLDEADMIHYANLLLHSDVVINVASSVTIDAAAFDTPIINIAFDGHAKMPYWKSVGRHYDETHYIKIVESGGARIAKNGEELIKHINDYLRDPSLDSQGRRRIVREQCHRLDGRAGERIARCVLNNLKSSSRGF